MAREKLQELDVAPHAPEVAQRARPAPADTLVAKAAALLQRDILSGELPPDSRLLIQDLADRYSIGATPLREALSRLVSTGLVSSIGQRGFRVAPLGREDLEDITRLRVLIETEALRLSMRDGDDVWEAGIVSSLYRLRVFTERNADQFYEDDWGSEDLHKSFHTALIAACGSTRMLGMHSALYDQAYRYRKLMMKRHQGPAVFVKLHTDLADLALARDVEQACQRLSDHLYLTLQYVYSA
jgi:GntR family carbon starvation induced transcriptional regulator